MSWCFFTEKKKKTLTKTKTNIGVAIFGMCSHTQFLEIHIQIGKKKKSHDIIITESSKLPNRACDMAKPVKALVTRPDKLSSSPRTHVVKDKISHKLSSDLHKSTVEVKSIINQSSILPQMWRLRNYWDGAQKFEATGLLVSLFVLWYKD